MPESQNFPTQSNATFNLKTVSKNKLNRKTKTLVGVLVGVGGFILVMVLLAPVIMCFHKKASSNKVQQNAQVSPDNEKQIKEPVHNYEVQ